MTVQQQSSDINILFMLLFTGKTLQCDLKKEENVDSSSSTGYDGVAVNRQTAS